MGPLDCACCCSLDCTGWACRPLDCAGCAAWAATWLNANTTRIVAKPIAPTRQKLNALLRPADKASFEDATIRATDMLFFPHKRMAQSSALPSSPQTTGPIFTESG